MKKIKNLYLFSALTIPILEIAFAENANHSFVKNIFSNNYVFTILLIIALVGAVIEILTPGFGVGGIISLGAFGIFFWGNIFLGNTNWYALVLFITGILLLGFEIIIPGFGICGISGIFSIIIALLIAMNNIYFAVFSLAIALLISIFIGYMIFRRGIDSEVVNRIRLFTSTSSEKGYISVENEDIDIGEVLETETVLKPTGYAIYNGKKMEVISESGYIKSNTKVIVTRLSGPRIYVKIFG